MLISHGKGKASHKQERQECIETKYQTIAVVIHSMGNLDTANHHRQNIYTRAYKIKYTLFCRLVLHIDTHLAIVMRNE